MTPAKWCSVVYAFVVHDALVDFLVYMMGNSVALVVLVDIVCCFSGVNAMIVHDVKAALLPLCSV